MAFGTSSKVFTAWLHDSVQRTGNVDLDDANWKVALFNDTVTPNQLVTAANSAYGGGVWTAGSAPNIVDTGSSAPAGWPYVGRPLAWGSATKLTTYSSATLKFDADDTVSANSVTTLTDARGSLVYDDDATTAVDQAIAYISFGGTSGVTLGTYTIVWSASGIVSIAA